MKAIFNLCLAVSFIVLTYFITDGLSGKVLAADLEITYSDTLSTSVAVNWFSKVAGTDKNLWAVSYLDENNGWVVGDTGTILRTTNGGENWIQQPAPTSANLFDICFVDSVNGWIVGDYKTILRTEDGGINWTVQSNNGPSYNLYAVSFTNLTDGTVVGHFGWFKPIILKTTNGGIDWFEQSQNANGSLSDVYFFNEYIGTSVGAATILRTTDGGANWINQSSGINVWLSGVSFTDINNGTAVGGDGTILKTTDGGENWISLASNETAFFYDVSCIDTVNAIVVGESGTILKTTNGGLNWLQQFSGTNNWLYAVHFINVNTGWAVGKGEIILKTTDGGTNWFQQSIGTTDLEEGKKNIPVEFTLSQNYPNPFNPSTSIQYRVSSLSTVSLKVYDVLGNEVATLVNEEKPAGTYEVKFNAAELSSGIYFYKLQAGNLVETKKMILLR